MEQVTFQTDYQGSEFAETLHIDKNGVRYDSNGDMIHVEEQSYNPEATAYRTESGQNLKYALVYPGPVNVHQNVPLTNFAVAFEQDSNLFIGPEVSPIHTVTKRNDDFYKLSKDDMLRDYGDAPRRAVGSHANSIQSQFELDNFTVRNYALRDFLPDETAENADEVLQLSQSIVQFLTFVLQYDHDRRLIDDILTTANLGDDTMTNLGGDQIGDATEDNRFIQRTFNAVNISVIRTNAMKGVSHVLMSADVAQEISQSTEIAKIVKHQMGVDYIANGGWAGPNFGLPPKLYGKTVVVMPHVQNTAVKGQTASFTDMLTDNMIFIGVEAPSRRTRNAVTTFRKGGLMTRTYRDEGRRGTFIEVEMIEVIKLTNSGGAFMATDCLA